MSECRFPGVEHCRASAFEAKALFSSFILEWVNYETWVRHILTMLAKGWVIFLLTSWIAMCFQSCLLECLIIFHPLNFYHPSCSVFFPLNFILLFHPPTAKELHISNEVSSSLQSKYVLELMMVYLCSLRLDYPELKVPLSIQHQWNSNRSNPINCNGKPFYNSSSI